MHGSNFPVFFPPQRRGGKRFLLYPRKLQNCDKVTRVSKIMRIKRENTLCLILSFFRRFAYTKRQMGKGKLVYL